MKTKFVGLFAIAMVFIFSCKKDILDEPKSPTVTLLSPTDKSNGIDIVPTFTWEASDPDGKSLTYDFYIGPDSTGLVKEASNLTSPEYVLTNYSLKKENTYYWCVYVNNGTERVRSKQWSFKSIPAPDSPILSGPTGGAFVRDQLTFAWQPVAAGAGETIVYDVYLGANKKSLEKIATVEGASTYSFDPSSLEIGKVYYWKVDASDLINASSSEISSFKKLMPGAPDEPYVVVPEIKSGIYSAGADLSWTAVNDPESDQVLYDIYMDNVYPPTTLLAEGVTTNNYTIAALDPNKPYFWQVVAKDGSNNYTNSAVFSFTKLAAGSPGAPVLADLAEEGMLSLDEVFKWDPVSEPDGQAVTYDVYVGDAFPPVNKVASDLAETEFQILNKDLSCDITNVKTFYCLVVAKDTDGNESNSVPVIFKPQMTGTMTDVRGAESITSPWVRMGQHIWLAQNLRTRFLTDGSSIVNITGKIYDQSDNEIKLYAEHPPVDGFPEDWLDRHGLVYTYALANDPLMYPSGWHVPDYQETGVMLKYADIQYGWNSTKSDPQVADILGQGEFHEGTDKYGLNLITAGFKYNSTSTSTSYALGFRHQLEKQRFVMWMSGGTDFRTLELYGPGGYKVRPYPYNNGIMYGLRLVKNK